MIAAMGKLEEVEIAAAADHERSVLDRFEADFGKPVYHDVEDMCLDPNLDAIYIATPNRFHVDHATAAFEHGKHVLLEKPMATKLEDTDRLIDLSEDKGLSLAVSAPHSVEPHIRMVSEFVETGTYGNLWAIQTMHFADWLYRPRTEEELNPDPQYGGGVLFRQAPHQMDIIRTIGGGLLSQLRASITVWDPARPIAGSYISSMQFSGGAFAFASYSGYDRFHSGALAFEMGDGITGDYAVQRKARAYDSSQDEAAAKRAQGFGGIGQAGPSPELALPPNFMWVSYGIWLISLEQADIRLTPDGLIIYGPDERQVVNLDTSDQGREEVVRRFYRSIEEGRKPEHDGRWGKATEEALLGMLQSSDNGGAEVSLRYQVGPGSARA
jgi:phthalate 4,5-cis-dihydrodiol dehydrogenase